MESNVSITKFIAFHVVTTTLETASKLRGRMQFENLKLFFDHYKKYAIEKKQENSEIDNSIFPLVRLFVPQLDKIRESYGLRTRTLAKRLITLLHISKSSLEGKELMAATTYTADFPKVAYQLLGKYFPKQHTLTVGDINIFLDKLAARRRGEFDGCFEEQIFKIFEKCTADEVKWLIHIILKNVRISNNVVLKAFHSDAVEYYAASNDLKKICDDLTNPETPITIRGIKLFTPFRPMLSKHSDKDDIVTILAKHSTLYCEEKFDGERFQLHFNKGEFKYFSRQGIDYTEQFGKDFQSGRLSPHLRYAFNETSSVILDGEMMGYNRNEGTYGTKAMNFDIKTVADWSTHQPCFFVFDILMRNDEGLNQMTYIKRHDILKKYIKPVQRYLNVVDNVIMKESLDFQRQLNDAIEKEKEGIIVKDPNSKYEFNSRNSGWWKIKPEYFDGVLIDLDVLIIGGFMFTTSFSSYANSYLVGIKDDTSNRFYSFAKVSVGFSYSEKLALHNKLSKFHKPVNSEDSHVNDGVCWKKEVPEFYIRPENSIILTIRTSELINSTKENYYMPYTLRFPRVVRIREDISYNECMTVNELTRRTTENKSVHKLFSRFLDETDFVPTPKRQPKSRIKITQPLKQDKVSDLLQGYEYCVMSGTSTYEKSYIENLIVINGGELTKEPTDNTYCALMGDNTPKLEAAKKNNVNVVKLSWLFNVLEDERFQTFGPIDVIYTNKKTSKRLKRKYDCYGDKLTPDDTEDIRNLQRVCEYMMSTSKYHIDGSIEVEEVQKLKSMIGLHVNSILYKKVCYFDDTYNQDSVCELINIVEIMGGIVDKQMHRNVAYVITEKTAEQLIELKQVYDDLVGIYSGEFVSADFIRHEWDNYTNY